MIRSISIGVIVLSLPHILISEPTREIVAMSSTPPVEILFSGIIPYDNGNSVLLRLDQSNGSQLESSCPNTQSIIDERNGKSVVRWKLDGKCRMPIITYKGVSYILPVNGAFPHIESLSDVSTDTLKNTLKASSIIKNDYRLSSVKVREFFEDIEKIIAVREQKFSLPIPESPLPTSPNHLPNAARPFRAKTTDGIHHGWDFYVKNGTAVRAIEEGTIIHVKTDFEWDEMNHLLDGDTDLEKQINLDTYRGNTVYLKTLSGHVAIYAHLGDIPSHITDGAKVKKGDFLGKVGDSAIPDKKYLYHLHFELAMNPFDDKKAGGHTFEDVLLWPFWGKGKNINWILENGKNLFE